VDEEHARHAIGRDEHDQEDDAARDAVGERPQHHSIDEIGHAKEVLRGRGAARIGCRCTTHRPQTARAIRS